VAESKKAPEIETVRNKFFMAIASTSLFPARRGPSSPLDGFAQIAPRADFTASGRSLVGWG
jgi:hypothetical protein